LPDEQARAVIAGVDTLVTDLADTAGNRPFVARFIELVWGVTGEIYGHTTYRQMLKLYAPSYRPSATLMQGEIKDARDRLVGHASPIGTGDRRLAPTPRAPVRSAGLQNSDHEGSAARELNRFLEMETRRLREALTIAQSEQRQAEAGAERESAARQSAELRAAALEAAHGEQTALIEKLTDTINRLQAQADASHRHALLQVDRVRSETRAAEDKMRQLERTLEARSAELRNERTTSDHLRRQNSELRNRLGAR
jgi:hypothetical protein